MVEHHIFIHMPYSVADLSAIAWDAERYPEFIKFISKVRIRQRQDDFMLADVVVRYNFLRETFTTDAKRDPETGNILVSLQAGPLRKLVNRWNFHPLLDGTTLVEFYVGYEFALPMLGRLFAAKADRAEKLIISAFTEQANRVCTPLQMDPILHDQVQAEIEVLERGLQQV